MKNTSRIAIENVNHRGKKRQVKAAVYQATKRAILNIVPSRSPGQTTTKIQHGVLPLLPEQLFPGGAKSGWWFKTVQLDLEAKGILKREKTTPLRLHKIRTPGQ